MWYKIILLFYQIPLDSFDWGKDFSCENLPDWLYHDRFCSTRDDIRALHQYLLLDLPVWPGYFFVTSVLSPLNANPLWQEVIIYDLPDSWVPETVLEGFRVEEEARRWDFQWRAEARRGVMLEPFGDERQPFASTHERFVVRMVNGRPALFDRQHSWTQPVYAPFFYYKP